jgi:hypothetical protein
MSKDLERALSKLRFDDQVLGYSLMTKIGRPFVSFAFPDELFPRVKDSIKLYKTDLRLMTIDIPELQLGLAIAKTKNVLRLLEGIELPPPPEDFEESSEMNIQVLESIAIKAASVEASPDVPPPQEESKPVEVISEPVKELAPKDYNVTPNTVPERGAEYSNSLFLDSALYNEMKKLYRNFGFDVLMLVDGNTSVEKIADSMFQPIDRITDLLKWTATKGIIGLPILSENPEFVAAGASLGKYVKCPMLKKPTSQFQKSFRL